MIPIQDEQCFKHLPFEFPFKLFFCSSTLPTFLLDRFFKLLCNSAYILKKLTLYLLYIYICVCVCVCVYIYIYIFNYLLTVCHLFSNLAYGLFLFKQ